MKENDKVLILKLLLKATFVLLSISVILKLLGLNIFGADTSNAILIDISDFIDKYSLKNPIDWLLLLIQYYLYFKLVCNDTNNKTCFLAAIIAMALTSIIQLLLFGIYSNSNIGLINTIYSLVTIFILLITPIIIEIFTKKKKINNNFNSTFKKAFTITVLITLYQIAVMFLRNITFGTAIGSLYDMILNFDYTILLTSTYYLSIKKDLHIELIKCFDFNLPNLLNEKPSFNEVKEIISKFNEFKQKFKVSNKEDKITIVLYIIFSVLSEIINVGLVIFIAYINEVTIECLFIITSFLISRKVFGAFHLNSAIKCWMLSNISFYLLSKLTINIGITYVIPVLCGIALSYITSRFIKDNNNNKLFKGMSKKNLLEISNSKKLTKLEFEILKKYYCEDINITNMTFTFHYSRAQLYRYKSNAEKN